MSNCQSNTQRIRPGPLLESLGPIKSWQLAKRKCNHVINKHRKYRFVYHSRIKTRPPLSWVSLCDAPEFQLSSLMAASIVRSPTNPLSTSKSRASEQRSKASVIVHVPYKKLRRHFPVLASLHGDDDNNNNNNNEGNAQALQLHRLLDDSQYDVVSKDPNMLPRNYPSLP